MLKKLIHAILIGFGITGVFTVLFLLGFFETWQNRLSDTLFPTRSPHPDIVIVAIDNQSIADLGRWPWSRNVPAELLEKLVPQKPAAIGIDISFLEPENASADSRLGSAIRSLGVVTLAAESDNNQVLLPLSTLQQNAKVGVVNTDASADGVTRHALLSFSDYNHFSLQVAQTYLNSKSLPQDKLQDIPTEEGNLLRINYAGPPGTFPKYSFVDAHNGAVPPQTFKDKIVLIGATAPDLHDNQATPTGGNTPMDGVEIQANAIQTLLDGKYLFPESPIATIITTLVLVLALSAVLSVARIIPGILIGLGLVVAYIIYAIVSFDAGIIRNLVFPTLAILTVTVANIVYKYFSESSQKRFIKKAFSYYLSGAVLQEILDNPSKLKLGGVREELTVLFSDIAGFTSISEKMPAEELAHLLNSYLTRMTNIVFKYKGVLDKYIGDAVMAFWGAPIKDPDHALSACRSALEMVHELQNLKEEWRQKGIKDFDIRIGINTGEMIVGNMGSDQRFDYTLIGDNVNLGSRLEGINKEYGTQIIMSEATYNKVKTEVTARKLDTVAVKGKVDGVVIYELRGLGTPSDEEAEFLSKFEEARSLYEKSKFRDSWELFKKLSKEYPNDNPTAVYLVRTRTLSKVTPRNWDGIYRAQTK